jgi:hypothetical protein
MPVRTYLARTTVSLFVAAATAAAVGVSSAAAATYDVVACTTNAQATPRPPISGADDAWSPETNDPTHLQLIRNCPPAAESELDGMLVQSKLNSSAAPQTSFAQWRFDAPAGASIMRLRLWREIGKRDNEWELYTRTADGARLGGTGGTSVNDSDCDRTPDVFTCQVGFPGSAAGDWTGLNTSSVRVGLLCALSSCATGATLHDAWTAIYGAIVTVEDPTPPTASGAGGNLLTDTYVRGNATATLDSASDVTGIRAIQVKEGGTLRGQTQRTCDYSRRVPCTNLTAPDSVTVATSGMADGPHTLAIGATDAAGNFTAAATPTVTVDNHAPAAATPTSPQQQTVTTPSATVGWQVPAGQVAPVTTAHITVCGPSTCRTTTPATGPNDGTATVALPDGFGLYSVLVSLEDAAGNVDSNQIATWQVSYPDPNPGRPPQQPTIQTPTPTNPAPLPVPQPLPTPQPAPGKTSARLSTARPTVARDRRTIAVNGTVATGTTGKVTLKTTAKIDGRTRTVTKRATIRSGRYAAHLKLPSAAWRTVTLTVTYPGDAQHRSARLTRRITQRAK